MIAFAGFVCALALAFQTAASSADEVLARWRESLDLDLPREVVAEKASIEAGGALASNGEAIALMARALFSEGREDDALALVAASRETDANRTALVLERARELLERDDLEAASKLVAGSKSIGPVRFPDRADCWLVRARCLARSGKLVDAAPLFERFLQLAPLSPDGPAACHQIAESLVSRGDAKNAQTWFDRALQLGTWQGFYRARRLQIREHPNEPLPRLGLGQLLLEANEFARAKSVFEELVRVAPNFANGWFHLGEAERQLRALDRAAVDYGKALELDPELANARFNRAVIARIQGRDADAKLDLEHLVSSAAGKDPRFCNAHLELARVLLRGGERAAADERYRRYVELGGKEPLEAPTGR